MKTFKNGIVTLGVFDGVHRGHQKILKNVLKKARAADTHSIVYTFDPHPARVLAPTAPLLLINTLTQRLELIKSCGLDLVIVEPFTREFARLSATDFFEKVLIKRLSAREIIVGYDFTFGSKREGTVEKLETLGKKHKIPVTIIPAIRSNNGDTVFDKGLLISSTQIRNFVACGRVREAAKLLGRNHFIDGIVIHGRGLGQKLGIETANLKSENELIPAVGVYSSTTTLGKKKIQSVTNIGKNPTFGGKTISIETHLLGFKGDLYGKKLRVEFINRIRDEMRFENAQALKRQIRNDIKIAKKEFKR
ncbi:MAG: bifunctional riboflavin kinase/FAD synthetase [Deltaproteobacteria bacterium]|nr:bifunctional riboflavin kinase/FAD synthetase [Deltaproteobacteria bacterium]